MLNDRGCMHHQVPQSLRRGPDILFVLNPGLCFDVVGDSLFHHAYHKLPHLSFCTSRVSCTSTGFCA